jgi:hypothetical protein
MRRYSKTTITPERHAAERRPRARRPIAGLSTSSIPNIQVTLIESHLNARTHHGVTKGCNIFILKWSRAQENLKKGTEI